MEEDEERGGGIQEEQAVEEGVRRDGGMGIGRRTKG